MGKYRPFDKKMLPSLKKPRTLQFTNKYSENLKFHHSWRQGGGCGVLAGGRSGEVSGTPEDMEMEIASVITLIITYQLSPNR